MKPLCCIIGLGHRNRMCLGMSIQERKELIKHFINILNEAPQRSILEFEGVDAQEYVNQLRDEWDQPE